jgi:predicted O-methyltransferase YrrM
MGIAIDIARAIVPRPARRYMRELQHREVLDEAMRRLLQLAPGADLPAQLARDLLHGWANEAISPSAEYVQAVWRHAAQTPGPVLECGSGLTTLVLGAAKRDSWHGVWSLEHDRFWAHTTRAALRRYGIANVVVCRAPLRDYGDFAWYDPQCALAGEFSLVLCDGPPGTTRGGRYGLIPVLGKYLRPGCVVLLDDATRAGERAVLARWKDEAQVTHVVRGSEKPFAEILVPGTPQAPRALASAAG